ncbi:hypothetical protein RB195_010070 [Necator americanus]|uniref:Uncharacterized protein n=1 Tax=Necator americanus TaxID=51031 RepID=A0ABR1CXH6_NECAM
MPQPDLTVALRKETDEELLFPAGLSELTRARAHPRPPQQQLATFKVQLRRILLVFAFMQLRESHYVTQYK